MVRMGQPWEEPLAARAVNQGFLGQRQLPQLGHGNQGAPLPSCHGGDIDYQGTTNWDRGGTKRHSWSWTNRALHAIVLNRLQELCVEKGENH